MADQTRLDRIFGHALIRIESAQITGPQIGAGYFDTAPITAERVADVWSHRGRSNAREQPSAGTGGFTLAGGLTFQPDPGLEPVPLDVATAFRVVLDRQAIGNVFNAGVPADIDGMVRFVGRVTELGDVEISPDTRAEIVPVTAATLLAHLDTSPASRAYTAGVSDRSILINLLTDVWSNDPAVPFGGWLDLPDSWFGPLLGVAPLPAGHRLAAWDTTGAAPSSVIADLAAATNAVLIERRDGTLDWLTADRRATQPAYRTPLVLPTDSVLAPLAAGKRIGDIANELVATYGDGSLSVASSYSQSQALYGILPAGQIDTHFAAAADAQAAADYVTQHNGWPAWRCITAVVDILALIERGDLALAQACIAIECEDLVEITGALPAHVPDTLSTAYFVGAIDESITSSSWRLTLTLIDRWLVDSPTWNDWPAGVTWDDVPPATPDGASINWLRTTTYVPA